MLVERNFRPGITEDMGALPHPFITSHSCACWQLSTAGMGTSVLKADLRALSLCKGLARCDFPQEESWTNDEQKLEDSHFRFLVPLVKQSVSYSILFPRDSLGNWAPLAHCSSLLMNPLSLVYFSPLSSICTPIPKITSEINYLLPNLCLRYNF